MSNWVVIVSEYQPRHIPWLGVDQQPPAPNTHYMPIWMSEHVPIGLTAFVAETNTVDVPVFDERHGEQALTAYIQAVRTTFSHTMLRLPQGPYAFKPFTWLQDQFGLRGLQSPHLYIDIYRTRPLRSR